MDVGEPPTQEPGTWSWVLGWHVPTPVPPWQGRLGSAEARAAVTPNRDLGAMVGWTGHGLPWSFCTPSPRSRPRDMLGAPDPRTAPTTTKMGPVALHPGLPEHRGRRKGQHGAAARGAASGQVFGASVSRCPNRCPGTGRVRPLRPWGRTGSADRRHPAPPTPWVEEGQFRVLLGVPTF